MKRIGHIIAALVLLTLPAVHGWTLGTSISDITGEPRTYVGETIRLRGEVTAAHKVPLMELWIETVYDKTGSLLVISRTEREAGARFRADVKIVGIATDDAESGGAKAAEAVADFLVEHELAERKAAGRSAEAVIRFLSTVLPHLDAAMFALEQGEI